jgi:hypothetical protein
MCGQVELIRQTPTQLGWRPNNAPGSPRPTSPKSPQPQEGSPKPKSEVEAMIDKHEAKITTMKSYGERLAFPGL